MTIPPERTVIVGQPYQGFSYGAGGASLPYWFAAQPQPGAFLEYAFDLSGLTSDEPITLMALDVKPAGPEEFQVAFLSLDGCLARFWGLAGVAGRVNTLRLTVGGPKSTEPILAGLVTSSALASYREPPPLIPGFGASIMWCQGQTTFQPIVNLPAITVMATGTTQLTAAPVAMANVLVNAAQAANAGIVLETPAAQFDGRSPMITNRSGVTINLYPNGSDAFEGQSAGTAFPLPDQSSCHLSVTQSGAILVTN